MSEILVGELSEFGDGEHRILMVGALEVGVFRQGDKVLAYENRCPHAGGPVCQGKIFKKVEEVLSPDKKSLGLRFTSIPQIVCPWHGYEFDIATGRHPGDPSVKLTPVPVNVKDGRVYIQSRA